MREGVGAPFTQMDDLDPVGPDSPWTRPCLLISSQQARQTVKQNSSDLQALSAKTFLSKMSEATATQFPIPSLGQTDAPDKRIFYIISTAQHLI